MPPARTSSSVAIPNVWVYWLVRHRIVPVLDGLRDRAARSRLAVAPQQNMLLLKPTFRLSCWPSRTVPLANGL